MPLILWAALGVVAMLLDAPGTHTGHDDAQLGLSILMMAFGIWGFWRHGDHQITAAGVYCLSSTMFVGFAGFWWWQQSGPVDDPAFYGTAAGFWTTLGMYAIFWRSAPEYSTWRLPDPSATAWGLRLGVLATFLAVAAGTAGLGSFGQFTIGGLALFLVSAMLHRANGRQIPLRLLLVLVAVGVYWQVAFDGFGRLSLASLAMIGAVVGSGLTQRRVVKAGVLAAMVPTAIFLVNVRNQIGAGAGNGSLVNPVHDFGRLVAAHEAGLYEYANGNTFVASVLFWVPRSAWADKPDGFGREMVGILEPNLLNTNHSMAALSLGEWFYNFGWVGLALMVAIVGLLVRMLDRGLARCTVRGIDSRRALLGSVVAVILVANIANLVWVGSFTYFSRSGQQLMLVLLVATWTATGRSDRRVDDRASGVVPGVGSTRSSRPQRLP